MYKSKVMLFSQHVIDFNNYYAWKSMLKFEKSLGS